MIGLLEYNRNHHLGFHLNYMHRHLAHYKNMYIMNLREYNLDRNYKNRTVLVRDNLAHMFLYLLTWTYTMKWMFVTV